MPPVQLTPSQANIWELLKEGKWRDYPYRTSESKERRNQK